MKTLAHHVRFRCDCEGREAEKSNSKWLNWPHIKGIPAMKNIRGAPAHCVNGLSLAYYFMLVHEIFIEPQWRFSPRR